MEESTGEGGLPRIRAQLMLPGRAVRPYKPIGPHKAIRPYNSCLFTGPWGLGLMAMLKCPKCPILCNYTGANIIRCAR